MRDLAYIARIQKLNPIPDKDRIELATVANYDVIVEKGKYRIGDLVVYIEYDTILPVKPEFEFLRKRCYSKLYDGFRIQAMKMAGVVSYGIVFSTAILPSDFKVEEGKPVAKELDIIRYDPEERKELMGKSKKKRSKLMKFLMKFKFVRKIVLKHEKKSPYPVTVQKSSETNVQKAYSWLLKNSNNEKYYLTEKLEGQAGMYMLKGNRLQVYSHNSIRANDGKNNWSKIAMQYKIRSILLRDGNRNYAIQGEIIGPGIQKNIYDLKELDFYVYKVTDIKTGKALEYCDVIPWCYCNGLKFVPTISYRLWMLQEFTSVDSILDHANGKSSLNENVMRAGVVWRSVYNQDLGFKAKSPEYLAWFAKSDKTE
jgi:hypothetical protein